MWIQILAQWFKFCTLKNKIPLPESRVPHPAVGVTPPHTGSCGGLKEMMTWGKGLPQQSLGQRAGLSTKAVAS